MRRVALVFAVALMAAACAGDEPSPPRASRFDPVERFEIDGRPSGLAVEGGKVFVADDEDHEVHVLSATTGEPMGDPIDVDLNPIAVAADDGSVWVAHAGGELTKIDAADAEVVESGRVGGSLTDVIAQDGDVWVIDIESSSAEQIDAGTGEVVRGVDVPEGAVRGAVGKEGLWVSGTEDAISRIELEPFVVRHVYRDVGGGPIGLAWDGHVMWAAISDDGTVVDVEGKTYEDPIEVGRGPVALAVLGDALYVVNQDDETLTAVVDGEVDGEATPLDTSVRDIASGDGALWICGSQTNERVNSNVVVRVEP